MYGQKCSLSKIWPYLLVNSGLRHLVGRQTNTTILLQFQIGMSSACINPIVYGYLNETFRAEFKEIGKTLKNALLARNCRMPQSLQRKPENLTTNAQLELATYRNVSSIHKNSNFEVVVDKSLSSPTLKQLIPREAQISSHYNFRTKRYTV